MTVWASAVACWAGSPMSCEHAADVLDVALRKVNGIGVVLQVVVAVGQAEPALVQIGDQLGGILKVLIGAEAEEHVHALAVQLGEQMGKALLILEPGNLVELALERGGAELLNAGLVHAGAVVVANLLVHRGAPGIGGGFFQNAAQQLHGCARPAR